MPSLGATTNVIQGLSRSAVFLSTDIDLVGISVAVDLCKMLNVIRSRCIAHSNILASSVSLQSRWSSSVEHTLQVRKDIERQRELSRQGGGPKRIASQHKKVSVSTGLPIK